MKWEREEGVTTDTCSWSTWSPSKSLVLHLFEILDVVHYLTWDLRFKHVTKTIFLHIVTCPCPCRHGFRYYICRLLPLGPTLFMSLLPITCWNYTFLIIQIKETSTAAWILCITLLGTLLATELGIDQLLTWHISIRVMLKVIWISLYLGKEEINV